MRMLGWDLGPCRLPLPDLGPEAFDTLQRNLDAIGFFRKVPLQQGMPVPL
jgi:N-acetylneuraminate lyase